MTVAVTFKALGDPIRLEMIKRLSAQSSHTVGSLSYGLGLTRQGARKHLQVLADARLVLLRPRGREVEVTLVPEAIDEAKAFMAELESRWDKRLKALQEFVED
jgi:DNA-binding transcriptional ArsR family regulator